MDPEHSTRVNDAPPGGGAGGLRRARLQIDKTLVPTVAVVAVAIASLVTAVMMSRQEPAPGNARPAASLSESRQVVKAPPLMVTAPPLRSPQRLVQARRAGSGPSLNTQAAGAGPGCRNCGVVESIASNRPSTYQLRVRMDDGTVKFVEQRGAFPAGSRVVLEGGTLKAAPDNG